MDTIKCNDVIDNLLNQANESVSAKMQADTIVLKAPMRPPVDDAVKDEIEELRSIKREDGQSYDRLVVILETGGGYVETVERISNVFRHHYKFVDFVVPNYAYSAGTLLVLSGDEIYMDYYSVLGPIDPQFENGDGMLPGMGYLAKFKELVGIVNAAQAEGMQPKAELAYLIQKFDPAQLFLIEQAIEHSKSLVREWLPKYKFKNWTVKQTSGAVVTDDDRDQRAAEIATVLGNAERWHSHGRGIGIKELSSDELKLETKNLGDMKELHMDVSHYYGLCTDYMMKQGYNAGLHTLRGLRRLG